MLILDFYYFNVLHLKFTYELNNLSLLKRKSVTSITHLVLENRYFN